MTFSLFFDIIYIDDGKEKYILGGYFRMLFTDNIITPFLKMEDFLFNSTVKDMQPYTVYKKDNNYIIEVKTLGINSEDVNVTLEENVLQINGETHNNYSDKTFNTNIKFRIEEELFNKIQNIEYTSANGLTYVTLILKKEKTNRIKITKK